MVDGFDLSSPLVCEGIVGDGCGGGRVFYIEDRSLYAYDPYSKSNLRLADGFNNALSIEKKACKVFITLSGGDVVVFDLSQMA
ncbi:MAG: thiamine biosynthesis protein ThiF [Campylobacterales bacterium]|nr:thiamine biosynthesis protein ThiF [Campylobacterales bacterium]